MANLRMAKAKLAGPRTVYTLCFTVQLIAPDIELAHEVGKLLTDYILETNETRTEPTDPKILSAGYQIKL